MTISYQDNSRRLGCIKYAGEFFEAHQYELQMIYTYFIPLDLHFDAAEDVFIVKGICDAFRPIALGERIPSYKAIFVENNRFGHLELTFQEVIE